MQKLNRLTIEYPEDVLLSLKEDKQEFEREARFILALKLYELGKLSSGKAAELAGINRIQFLMKLAQYRVSPFQEDLNEILGDNELIPEIEDSELKLND